MNAAVNWLRPPRCRAPAPKQHLWPHEKAVLCQLVQAAHWGRACPTTRQLAEHLLPAHISETTIVEIVKRLEAWGFIQVERYQRGRRVMIAKTGRSTREPRNLSPHWRAVA